MQANEIVEENSIESISLRTRIPEEALRKLFAGECADMQKVHVQGFLSILEREYRADLSTLRETCLACLEEDPNDSIVITIPPEMARTHRKPLIIDADRVDRGRFLKPIAIGLVGLMLLYGAWSTLDVARNDSNRTSRGDVGFFSSVLRQIQQQVNADKSGSNPKDATPNRDASEKKTDQNVAGEAIQKEKADGDQMYRDDNIIKAENSNDLAHDTQSDAKNSASNLAVLPPKNIEDSERKIDNMQPDMTNPASIGADVNTSRQSALTVTESTAEQLTQELADDSDTDVMTKDDANASLDKPSVADAQVASEPMTKVAIESPVSQEPVPVVTLVPRAKIWLGVVDLIAQKRKVITTKKPMPFSDPKGRWIVAVGHGRLELRVGDRPQKFNDSQKHFFLIEKGTAKEISHKHFQKLNKSKVW